MPNEIGELKIGQLVINVFSNKSIKRGFVETELSDGVFAQTLNSPKMSLVISLSGKVLGVGIEGKIYPLTYFQ